MGSEHLAIRRETNAKGHSFHESNSVVIRPGKHTTFNQASNQRARFNTPL